MTAKQVYDKIGKEYGKSGFAAILDRIKNAHKLAILDTDESCDEEGKHSHAMVLFGYKDSAFDDFKKAFADVYYILKLFDFSMSYECSGDGDGCILVSYRIV